MKKSAVVLFVLAFILMLSQGVSAGAADITAELGDATSEEISESMISLVAKQLFTRRENIAPSTVRVEYVLEEKYNGGAEPVWIAYYSPYNDADATFRGLFARSGAIIDFAAGDRDFCVVDRPVYRGTHTEKPNYSLGRVFHDWSPRSVGFDLIPVFGDPWGSMRNQADTVTFTDSDREAYLQIMRMGNDAVLSSLDETLKANKDEHDAFREEETDAALRGPVYTGSPSDRDISGEDAVCYAYAFLEQAYGIPRELLHHYRLTFQFHRSTLEDSYGIWDVYFNAYGVDAIPGWYQVGFYIHSTEGTILNVTDTTNTNG